MEKEIKKLLGIGEGERVKAVKRNVKRKGNREYLYLIVETIDGRGKKKQYHVPSHLSQMVEELWRKEKKRREKLRKLAKEFLDAFGSDFVGKEIRKLILQSLEKRTYGESIQTYTKKAKSLFEEFREVLLKLYEEEVFKRISVLQALYLLSNLKELSKSSENSQYFFNRGLNTIIKVCKNERIENPFGTLKNDFFLSGRKTPYDFLLSNFLEELIGDTLLEILKSEYEKKKALKEAHKYKEKMEKLKEIVEWFEKQSPEVKSLAKTIVSQNVLEIAEKILKEMQITKLSLKEVETFLMSSPSDRISQYFEYLKSL